MKIENFDTDQKVFIIAEIGNNHEGSYTLAEELIGLAKNAGASAVKFQTIIPEKLVSIDQKERLAQLKKYSLSYKSFEKLSKVAKKENILFLSTPFDIESAHFLDSLVPAYKIASGDNNFFPLIEVIAKKGKPVFLSSGLADLKQIKKTKVFIENSWKKLGIEQDLAILHCVVSYPTLPKEVNLLAIRELQKIHSIIGYSDHSLGIEAAVLSVALGACIVEKHFTINKHYSDFRDHQLAADPKDFKQMVQRIHETLEILGQGKKNLQESEKKNLNLVRRSIVASRPLKAGSLITELDISWVRPAGGLPPGEESKVIHKVTKKMIREGEIIRPRDLKN